MKILMSVAKIKTFDYTSDRTTEKCLT